MKKFVIALTIATISTMAVADEMCSQTYVYTDKDPVIVQVVIDVVWEMADTVYGQLPFNRKFVKEGGGYVASFQYYSYCDRFAKTPN